LHTSFLTLITGFRSGSLVVLLGGLRISFLTPIDTFCGGFII